MSSQFEPSDPVNPYAPPVARIDDLQAAEIGELASRGLRLGAYLIDMMVFAIPVAIIAGVFAVYFREGRDAHALPPFGILSAALGVFLLVVAIVDLVLVFRYQQSIGKRLCKIKVVRNDGSRCNPWRIVLLRGLLTAFIGKIPIVGLAFQFVDPLLIFREDHRCIHDLMADTRVVTA